jgi:uncharacterized membrane protein YsdA (DUF1294 family)
VTVEFFDARKAKRLVRRISEDGTAEVTELTARGWRAAPRFARARAQKELAPLAPVEAFERMKERLNDRTLVEGPCPGAGWWGRLREWVAPPLAYGAPRHPEAPARDAGRRDPYDSRLPTLSDEVRAALVEQARDGYERQGKRVEGIERRAAIYQGSASVSGGLVITGTGLISGKDVVPQGDMRAVLIAGLIVASACLLVSGWRAHQASVYVFTWVRPNAIDRVLRRAKAPDVATVERSLLTALLLAQDRGALIADWKLGRLKQAARAFVAAVVVSVVVSAAFVVSLLQSA